MTPDELRAKANEYRERAKKASEIARHSSDYAPGSFVTGASGRTCAQNRKTDRALDKTIQYSRIAREYTEKAGRLEARAKWIGDAPKREQARRDRADFESAERKSRKTLPIQDRLLVCAYPTGLVYADKGRCVNNDYPRVAYINYRTLVLDLDPKCPEALADLIRKDAEALQAKRGQFYPTSACGQGVILGE